MSDMSDPQLRNKLLLGVALIGGLGYLAHDMAYRPRAEELAALETRLETLETQNRRARGLIAGQGTDAAERRLRGYREQLRQVEHLIPSSEELPDLLDAISAEAQRTGVELTLIQPVGATQEEYYTRRSYDLAVIGSYHRVAEFLSRVGSLPRIVSPVDLNMTVHEEETRSGEPELEAKFSIETYVLPNVVVPAEDEDES